MKGQRLFFQILGNSWVCLHNTAVYKVLGIKKNGFRCVKIRVVPCFCQVFIKMSEDTHNYPIPGPFDSFCAGKGWRKRLLLLIFIYSPLFLSNLSSIHFHSIYLSHLSILFLRALTLLRLPRKTLAHTFTRTHLYNRQDKARKKE